jgi:hypothetical protein
MIEMTLTFCERKPSQPEPTPFDALLLLIERCRSLAWKWKILCCLVCRDTSAVVDNLCQIEEA